MRIWYGVHPSELDNQRLLAQHNEIHALYGTIRNSRALGKLTSELCLSWGDDRGIAALVYFHDLISGPCFNRFCWNHQSPLNSNYDMENAAANGKAHLDHLLDPTTNSPKMWPPNWITPKQRISDLMDLQIRWANEAKNVELSRSIERYGLHENGLLSGSQTRSESVTDAEVERFLAHRALRRKTVV